MIALLYRGAARRQEFMATQMQALAEIISGAPTGNRGGGGNNKSRAKGLHPEKLERDLDYATFFQWRSHGICMSSAISYAHSCCVRACMP